MTSSLDKNLTVCYFGIYNPEYCRNRILMKGLRKNGVTVIECQSSLRGVRKYFDLAWQHWKIRHAYDVMVVGFPGYQCMILARLLSRKRIIFDAFTSFYDTQVEDRALFSERSLRAKYCWLMDWLACRLADKILLDTYGNIRYFQEHYHIKEEKFQRIFVGSDEEILPYVPPLNATEPFIVHFHGTFIPLHGVSYILSAAKVLENEGVIFRIVGPKMRQQFQEHAANNAQFIDFVTQDKLGTLMGESHVCLGIFGNTDKAKRVIPNKLYEAMAVGRPVITGDSPAVKELLEDGKNVLLCRMADPQDLAEKILMLKRDVGLRNSLASEAYELFRNRLTQGHLAGELLSILCLH